VWRVEGAVWRRSDSWGSSATCMLRVFSSPCKPPKPHTIIEVNIVKGCALILILATAIAVALIIQLSTCFEGSVLAVSASSVNPQHRASDLIPFQPKPQPTPTANPTPAHPPTTHPARHQRHVPPANMHAPALLPAGGGAQRQLQLNRVCWEGQHPGGCC